MAAETVQNAPAMSAMVTHAIVSLKERSGSSRSAIKKFVISNYSLQDTNVLKSRISLALKKMLKDGRLEMIKASFKISKDKKKELTKQPKQEGKPAGKNVKTIRKDAGKLKDKKSSKVQKPAKKTPVATKLKTKTKATPKKITKVVVKKLQKRK